MESYRLNAESNHCLQAYCLNKILILYSPK